VAEGGGETKEKCPLGPDCPRRDKRLLDGARGVPRGVPEASVWGRRVGDEGVPLADPEVGGRGVSCLMGLRGPAAVSLISRRWKVKRGYPESVRSRRGEGELPDGPSWPGRG
jgi:hypothetical protein